MVVSVATVVTTDVVFDVTSSVLLLCDSITSVILVLPVAFVTVSVVFIVCGFTLIDVDGIIGEVTFSVFSQYSPENPESHSHSKLDNFVTHVPLL